MQFIAEQNILIALENLNDFKYLEGVVEKLETEQPILLAYLFSENAKLLTQDEQEYLIYLLSVVWESIRLSGEEVPSATTEDQIGKLEEQNWEVFENAGKKGFREKLDPFFEGYTQEDLLAFVEDALTRDDTTENDIITKTGREPMFIIMKTVIDVLCE